MTAATADAREDDARPAAIEEPLNSLLVHPLAHLLLPVAIRLRIPPNAVSLTGIGFGIVAAAAYHAYGDWRYVLAGFAAMLGWHVCDGLDGMLARATGRTTALGRFLDGVCDYSVFVLVHVSLMHAASAELGAAAWWLGWSSGAAHIVQAAWYEGLREAYLRRVKGAPIPAERRVAGGWMEKAYNALQARVVRQGSPIDGRAVCSSEFRERYKAALEPVVRRASSLGATNRTVGVAIACLVGSPAYFWLWEMVVLSVIGVLIERQRCVAESRLIL